MTDLKHETVSGIIWSFMDSFASQGITFIIGIVLARLLSPAEFGLIGIITIFIAISSSFINSGFAAALVRKQNCTDKDYSTVFYFNLLVGIIFYFILFFSAAELSSYFKEPQITILVQVLGIILIIDSLSIVQRTILTKRINFKLQTKISIIASIVSGIIALIMAFKGYGVWSLVAKQISQQAINASLLWVWNKWQPSFIFSIKSFRELFTFGYKLLISSLIDTIYRNVYYLIIGKYFSAKELGFYTRADQFQSLPSSNLQSIIGRVSYPVLSSMQNDLPRLKSNYKKLIRSTMFITFVLMLGMAAVAKPMIITLIGEKWSESIIYLQMLCFVGMMYPLHSLNLNMLQVLGRSDLFLKLEIIKKILAIPTIVIGVIWSIRAMIAGMIVYNLIAYYLNSYWSGPKIGYSMKEQLKDILPSLGLALLMSILVFTIGIILPFNYLSLLIIQVLFGAGFIIGFCEIIKFKDYLFIKNLMVEKLIRRKELPVDQS